MTVVNDSNVYLPSVVTTPSSLEITDITREQQMQITTTMTSDQANTYVVNMVVNLTVPYTWGMWQANGLKGIIISVVDNVIKLAVDSTNFDAFSNPNDGTQASLAPSGSRNLTYNNNSALSVPFRSLNNVGN